MAIWRKVGDGNMLIKSWYRSQPALDNFQNESTATWIKASLFPSELYQHIYTSMYEWVGRSQRTKKMTKKGPRRKDKMYSRSLSVVQDLIYSCRKMIAVEEEMLQLNGIFKLLMTLHREYGVMLSEEQQMENDNWFDFGSICFQEENKHLVK